MKLLTFLLSALTLLSPDGKVCVKVDADIRHDLSYSVSVDGKCVVEPSQIALQLSDGTVLGGRVKPVKVVRRNIDESIPAQVYTKSLVRNRCNEMELVCKYFSVVFRAYDDGVAWRFRSRRTSPVTISGEVAEFNFPSDYDALVPYVKVENPEDFASQYMNSFENVYSSVKVSGWDKRRLAFLPVEFSSDNIRLCITESDLWHYPGMFLCNTDGGSGVKGVFAPCADETERGGYGDIQMKVNTRKDYIAVLDAGQALPWRIIGLAREDKGLLNSDLVFNLASPAADTDWSWVKPGKVAWDWWNDFSLRGVDFYPAVNNATYEYYIDFASRFGIPYIIMDEGWSPKGKGDLMQVVPEIDMKHLVDYAAERNVGIILWAGFDPFRSNMEAVCKHYSEMGIKGFKIDFLDRDDQQMMDYYYKGAAVAAEYHLMIDYHGVFKPAGINRTFPNVVNFEGVFGLENMKWEENWKNQPDYDVQLPFIRMFAGPMDYTPGAMRNAGQWSWHASYSEPSSQGTRCHQLAEYVVFDQPLAMMCDSPSNYYAEPEFTQFMADIPTVWDETRVLDGKIGSYVVLARRKGEVWYVGALGGWNGVELNVKFDFLPGGEYVMTRYCDGYNAGKVGIDYRKSDETVRSGETVSIAMASGGGWVARIREK